MRRANGFTLIEMLVALAVFSIAALALLRLDGFAVATTADLAARAGATLVAENEAALIATDPAPAILGTSTREHSNGGRSFVIQQAVAPTADQRLVRVDLAVIDRGSGARALLTLIKRVR
jgi:general secretion pathway protein I